MQAILDYAFMGLASLALITVCFANRIKIINSVKYGASHRLVAAVIFIEIMFMDYYSVANGATPYKMYAFVQLLSLVAMFALRGGGAWKIAIMALYAISQTASFICYNYFYGVKFPYLDIINAVGYAQLFILLYSPKTESKEWYVRISDKLTGLPILGDYFGYYICNHLDGTPKKQKAKT